MGQYWYVVNLDKREFIHPHKLGCGLKLWEQIANHPGTGAALLVLCAAMPEARGGGDFDMEENWHGPERQVPGKHSTSPAPMPEAYAKVAKRTIGRWAGCRIALVGDYSEDTDLPAEHHASRIYGLCSERGDWKPDDPEAPKPEELYRDVSADVARVLEHELCGKFSGDGWRQWRTVFKPDELRIRATARKLLSGLLDEVGAPDPWADRDRGHSAKRQAEIEKKLVALVTRFGMDATASVVGEAVKLLRRYVRFELDDSEK
jgi:hypothetical protein